MPCIDLKMIFHPLQPRQRTEAHRALEVCSILVLDFFVKCTQVNISPRTRTVVHRTIHRGMESIRNGGINQPRPQGLLLVEKGPGDEVGDKLSQQ